MKELRTLILLIIQRLDKLEKRLNQLEKNALGSL